MTMVTVLAVAAALVVLVGVGVAGLVQGATALEDRFGTRHRATREAWARVAEERGWIQQGTHPYHYRHEGSRKLAVRRHQSPEGTTWTEARIVGAATEGTIRPERTPETPTDFERAAFLQVPPELVPRYGHRFREAFVAALAAGLHPRIDEGDVVVQIADLWPDAPTLRSLADHATRLAGCISVGPMDEVLAQEIVSGGSGRFRVRCMELLAAQAPERVYSVATEVLDDPDATVAVDAAAIVGDPERLIAHLQVPVAEPLVLPAARGVLSSGDPGQVAQALELASAHASARALRQLFGHLAVEGGLVRGAAAGLAAALTTLDRRDPPVWGLVAIPYCHAIATQATAGAVDVLIDLLQRTDPDLVVAAAEALGRVADVAVVPVLTARSEARPTLDPRARTACRQAIRRIQDRTSGSPGDLSLAEPAPEQGAVSIVEAHRRGTLSIPER